MADPADKRMTIDEFLAWCDKHAGDEVYELVDGRPVPKHKPIDDGPRMMTRPGMRHQLIGGNVHSALRERLRGGPCTPFAEVLIETSADQFRVPDLSVICDLDDIERRVAPGPTVIVEILSPSTGNFDLYEKHSEYRSIKTVRHIVFVSSERIEVAVWSREADAWSVEMFRDLDAIVPLPGIGTELPVAAIYEDARFVIRTAAAR